MRGGSSYVYERQQGSDRLLDTVPFLRSLIFVIVRRIGRLGYSLKPCNRAQRPAILHWNIPGNYSGQSPMIALNAHDARSGDPKIGRTEVANTDKVSRDERVF